MPLSFVGSQVSYAEALKRLVLGRKRGKGRLPPAADRGVIPGAIGIGERDEGSVGGGLPPSITEVIGARRHYPDREYTDTSGLFVIVRRPVQQTQFAGVDGSVITVNYQEPDNES